MNFSMDPFFSKARGWIVLRRDFTHGKDDLFTVIVFNHVDLHGQIKVPRVLPCVSF